VREAAAKIGVGHNTLYRAEEGRHLPQMATARKIAEFYGVEPEAVRELAPRFELIEASA
jgi:DNA-binding XRE family transcriptional regulator